MATKSLCRRYIHPYAGLNLLDIQGWAPSPVYTEPGYHPQDLDRFQSDFSDALASNRPRKKFTYNSTYMHIALNTPFYGPRVDIDSVFCFQPGLAEIYSELSAACKLPCS